MGSTKEQLRDEIHLLAQEERTTQVISLENALALKADLVIPWNKFRALRRYTPSGLYTGFLPRGGKLGVCQNEGWRGCS